MTEEFRYLRLEDLVRISTHAAGAPPDVRDYGLLESATARPQATVFGRDAYPTLTLKAAALTQSIVTNHALVDGNKRLGLLALLLFLGLNGYTVEATQRERADLILAIADGTLRDVEEIAARIEAILRPR